MKKLIIPGFLFCVALLFAQGSIAGEAATPAARDYSDYFHVALAGAVSPKFSFGYLEKQADRMSIRADLLEPANLVRLGFGGFDDSVEHGGGLNACGCHFNRKTGGCHCHQDRGCGCECQPARCP